VFAWLVRGPAPLTVLCAGFLLYGSRSGAQPERLLVVTDIGQMRLTLSNCGTFGMAFQSREAPSMVWPVSTGIDHLARAGLWVGGLDAATGDTLVTIGARDANYTEPVFLHAEFTPAGGRPQEFSRIPSSPYYRAGTVKQPGRAGRRVGDGSTSRTCSMTLAGTSCGTTTSRTAL
jgi:hypothetical protein